MKNIFIILILCVNCIAIKAQTTEERDNTIQKGLTNVELQKAIETYVKMTETETYKANKKATHKMIDKLNQKVIPKEIMNDNEWERWIAENLNTTKFISIGEANKLRTLNLELTKKQYAENAELYVLIRKATMSQRHEILKPERAGRPF
jgi:hypothetical protein